MNFADKKTRLYGLAGGVAVLAVLYTWVLQPLGARWADLGQQLEPKQAQVDQFREQVYGHEALIAKRESLVKRMGSLLGPQTKDAKQEGKDKAAKEKATEEKSREKKEAASTATPSAQPPTGNPQADKPADQPSAPSADAKQQEVAKQPEPQPAKATPTAPETPKDAAATANAAPSTVPSDAAKDAAPKPPAAEAGAKPAPEVDAKAGADKPAGGKSPEKGGEKGTTKDSAAPQQSGDRRLAAYFDKTAAQSGLKIKRVTVKKASGGPKGVKSFVPVALQINVEGNAESLMKFLYQVEKGDRFARVDQLEIHRDVAKGNTIDANLDVSGYQE